ncbi:polyphosphate polymerase domain-containing protein [Nocardioides alcanivorans]|uniref:polyphosphate polymerase domain-containing protein n=1 Tax=Nocardioides alcanivorans TaxID=2897352 RepID=UPI001F47DE51|nr:polyphosphate polymerase domain-containing protein [Nocardioides alcanivorans]
MTTLAAECLSGFEPIGLEELVERAELLTRVDRKYVVSLHEAHAVLADLPEITRVLEIDGRRSFGYRSAYLDTPNLASYLSAGRSHRLRWKVRTRAYLDELGSTTSTWLEVKTRAGRGQTVKQRIAHPDAQTVSAASAARSAYGVSGLNSAGRDFVADIIGARHADVLRPVLATGYQRSTFFLPASASRVTVDVDLGWSSLRTAQDLERPGLAIVETKTGSTPSVVDRILWTRGHRPLRISKYGVGMAGLDSSLLASSGTASSTATSACAEPPDPPLPAAPPEPRRSNPMNDTFQSPPPTSRRTSWRHRTAALSTIAVLMLASACGGAGAADSPTQRASRHTAGSATSRPPR